MDLAKAKTFAGPLVGGAATVSDLEAAISALKRSINIGGHPAHVVECRRALASVREQLDARRAQRRANARPRVPKVPRVPRIKKRILVPKGDLL